MIIKGGSTGGAGRIAAHLLSGENEKVQVKELRGVMTADNLRDALREMETAAKCTAARKPLYHASINPRVGENLSAEQWAARWPARGGAWTHRPATRRRRACEIGRARAPACGLVASRPGAGTGDFRQP